MNLKYVKSSEMDIKNFDLIEDATLQPCTNSNRTVFKMNGSD